MGNSKESNLLRDTLDLLRDTLGGLLLVLPPKDFEAVMELVRSRLEDYLEKDESPPAFLAFCDNTVDMIPDLVQSHAELGVGLSMERNNDPTST